MKVLLATFSDNPDHQDIAFGMYEALSVGRGGPCEPWLMAIQSPKAALNSMERAVLVDCPRRPGLSRKALDIRGLVGIIRWINAQRFDAVFLESLHIWNLPILAHCRGARLLQMLHDPIPHAGDRQAVGVALMNRAVTRLADRVVLCSRAYADLFARRFGLSRDRLRCVDMWRRFPAYTPPRHTGRALFFGRLNPYKGVDNLAEIAALCPEVRFDVVGRVDPSSAEAVSRLNDLPNVRLDAGFADDARMREAFSDADWIVLPYNSATQSGVIIDAYRYGRPVIAFDVGALNEQVREGESGFLVRSGDNAAFAHRLREAVRMRRDDYDRLSRAAYAYGREKYAAEGAADRFMDLLAT